MSDYEMMMKAAVEDTFDVDEVIRSKETPCRVPAKCEPLRKAASLPEYATRKLPGIEARESLALTKQKRIERKERRATKPKWTTFTVGKSTVKIPLADIDHYRIFVCNLTELLATE